MLPVNRLVNRTLRLDLPAAASQALTRRNGRLSLRLVILKASDWLIASTDC